METAEVEVRSGTVAGRWRLYMIGCERNFPFIHIQQTP